VAANINKQLAAALKRSRKKQEANKQAARRKKQAGYSSQAAKQL